jgi:hypothetical protein
MTRILSCFIVTVLLFFSSANAETEAPMINQVELIKNFYKDFNVTTPQLVDAFYDTKIEFQDPVHELKGLNAVRDYYLKLYKNVKTIRFDFTRAVSEGNTHVVFWDMTLETPKLNSGEPYKTKGNSLIVFSPETQKVIYHRDYFDMGEFVYERIPVLKSIILYIKKGFQN